MFVSYPRERKASLPEREDVPGVADDRVLVGDEALGGELSDIDPVAHAPRFEVQMDELRRTRISHETDEIPGRQAGSRVKARRGCVEMGEEQQVVALAAALTNCVTRDDGRSEEGSDEDDVRV